MENVAERQVLLNPFYLFVPAMLAFPFLFGSARPWFWGPILAYCYVIWGWFWYRGLFKTAGESLISGLKRREKIAAFLVSVWILAQAIPLPPSLVEHLSPARFQLIVAKEKFLFLTSGWVTLSYIPMETFFGFLWWVGLLMTVYFVFTVSGDSGSRRFIYITIFAVCGFEAVYGLIQVLFPSVGVLWDGSDRTGMAYAGCARGTFINRNHFASFINLCWPYLLANTMVDVLRHGKMKKTSRGRKRAKRHTEHIERMLGRDTFVLFFLGCVILALIFSKSRAGIVNAIIGLIVFLVLSGSFSRKVLWAVGFCVFVVILYSSILGFAEIYRRFLFLVPGLQGRLAIWHNGWAMLKDHPVVGTGWGTYFHIEGLYREMLPDVRRAGHLHNDYLEWLVELGFPAGALLITLLWMIWLRFSVKLLRLRRFLDSSLVFKMAGLLSGMVTLLLHGLVDFPFHIPAIFFYLACLTGLLLRYGSILETGWIKKDHDRHSFPHTTISG